MEEKYYIAADTKYDFQDEYKTAFIGYDIGGGAYPVDRYCWQQGSICDRTIEVFSTAENAKHWFSKNKNRIIEQDTEVKNIRIVKMLFQTVINIDEVQN